MNLQAWSVLVTGEVRERLPDVRASRRGTRFTWTLGSRSATLDAYEPRIWWLRTGAALTYFQQADERAARVAASNILAHFDARSCRGIDHEPFTDAEMRRFETTKAAHLARATFVPS